MKFYISIIYFPINTLPQTAIKASNGSEAFSISDPCFKELWKTLLKSFKWFSFFLTVKNLLYQICFVFDLQVLPSSSISMPLLNRIEADLLMISWSLPSYFCQFAMAMDGMQLSMVSFSVTLVKFDKKAVKPDYRLEALKLSKLGHVCFVISQ